MCLFLDISSIHYDWISNNWYFVDSHNNLVILCSSTLLYCHIILHLSPITSSKIQSIALDPNDGYMFLLKHDIFYLFAGSLQRYSLDGSQQKTLLDYKISRPKEITLDIVTKRIYFLDRSYNYIQQCDYNGNNRKFLTKMFLNLFSKLQFFENYFYAVDQVEHEIIKIDKSKPFIKEILMQNLETKIQSIKVFNKETQRIDHETCKNSKCQHLCVPVHNETNKLFEEKCLCNDGFELGENNSCIQNKRTKFLVYIKGSPSRIGATSIDKFENDSIIVPVVERDIHESVDVNLDDKLIYFSSMNDAKRFDIRSQNFNGSVNANVLPNLVMTRSLAYDWFGRNLFLAYSESGSSYKIAAVKIDRKNDSNVMIKSLITKDIDIPFAMTLDVEDGFIYWSSWTDKYSRGGRIESAWMDGTNRKLLIEHNGEQNQLYWPRSLTLYKKQNMLFWIDVLRETVESINLANPSEIKIYNLGINLNPHALTVIDDAFYLLNEIENTMNLYYYNSTDELLR